MRWRALAAGGMALAIAVVVAACGSGSSRSAPPAAESDRPAAEKAVEWAGFKGVGELEVVAVDEDAGIDTGVRFALRGPAPEVDRLLADAGFTAPASPGIKVFEPPLPGVVLESLQNPRTGKDEWRNGEGRTIHRRFVRGAEPDGGELIHVWAFTT